MSENTASPEKEIPTPEIDAKLDKTQLLINTYQAAKINKLLEGTWFRLDLFEIAKRKINSSLRTKSSKAKAPNYSAKGYAAFGADSSEPDQFVSQSISSHREDDNVNIDEENGIGRRTSRREKKPTKKEDLGYEEPKPLKGVKLTSSAKEVMRRCEEVLVTLKDEFCKVPDFSSKAAKFDQEIKKLKEGQYRNTMMLGNTIRKYLNSILASWAQSQPISIKAGTFINKFEDCFASLDNKTLFEESKYEPLGSK